MVEWMQGLERRVRRSEDSVSAVTLAVGSAAERSRSAESRTRMALWSGGLDGRSVRRWVSRAARLVRGGRVWSFGWAAWWRSGGVALFAGWESCSVKASM